MTHPAAGILNRPPAHLLAASLTLTPNEPVGVRQVLDRLRDLQRRELRSDLDETTPQSDKNIPSAETGSFVLPRTATTAPS